MPATVCHFIVETDRTEQGLQGSVRLGEASKGSGIIILTPVIVLLINFFCFALMGHHIHESQTSKMVRFMAHPAVIIAYILFNNKLIP